MISERWELPMRRSWKCSKRQKTAVRITASRISWRTSLFWPMRRNKIRTGQMHSITLETSGMTSCSTIRRSAAGRLRRRRSRDLRSHGEISPWHITTREKIRKRQRQRWKRQQNLHRTMRESSWSLTSCTGNWKCRSLSDFPAMKRQKRSLCSGMIWWSNMSRS